MKHIQKIGRCSGVITALALSGAVWAQGFGPQALDKDGLPLPEGINRDGAWQGTDKPGGYHHWTAEAWTGDDTPFIRIRRNIDRQVQQGKKPMALLKAYRSAALKKPMDAQAQFRWAYAAFVAYQKFEKGQNLNEILKGVGPALERPLSPKSYEYARMRTIFTQWDKALYNRHSAYLPKVVMRLAKRNPRDYILKYIFALEFLENKATQDVALQWAKEYRRAFPNKPNGLFLLGRVYEGQFGIKVSESKGKIAIGYFQMYLKALPPNDLYRPLAQWHIDEIQRRTKLFRSKGMLRA